MEKKGLVTPPLIALLKGVDVADNRGTKDS